MASSSFKYTHNGQASGYTYSNGGVSGSSPYTVGGQPIGTYTVGGQPASHPAIAPSSHFVGRYTANPNVQRAGGSLVGNLLGQTENLISGIPSVVASLPGTTRHTLEQGYKTTGAPGWSPSANLHEIMAELGIGKSKLHVVVDPTVPKSERGLGGYLSSEFWHDPRTLGGQVYTQPAADVVALRRGDWHYFQQHPLNPILDIATAASLGGGAALNEARLGTLGERAQELATTERLLKDGNHTEALNQSRTLQGRIRQRAYDNWSMNHPDNPLFGAPARMKRILDRRVNTEMIRAHLPLRVFQRATRLLDAPELFAFHVAVEGVPLDERIAYYTAREQEILATLSKRAANRAKRSTKPRYTRTPLRVRPIQQYLANLKSPAVQEALLNPRQEFIDALWKGAQVEGEAGRRLVQADMLSPTTRTERALLPTREMTPPASAPGTLGGPPLTPGLPPEPLAPLPSMASPAEAAAAARIESLRPQPVRETPVSEPVVGRQLGEEPPRGAPEPIPHEGPVTFLMNLPKTHYYKAEQRGLDIGTVTAKRGDRVTVRLTEEQLKTLYADAGVKGAGSSGAALRRAIDRQRKVMHEAMDKAVQKLPFKRHPDGSYTVEGTDYHISYGAEGRLIAHTSEGVLGEYRTVQEAKRAIERSIAYQRREAVNAVATTDPFLAAVEGDRPMAYARPPGEAAIEKAVADPKVEALRGEIEHLRARLADTETRLGGAAARRADKLRLSLKSAELRLEAMTKKQGVYAEGHRVAGTQKGEQEFYRDPTKVGAPLRTRPSQSEPGMIEVYNKQGETVGSFPESELPPGDLSQIALKRLMEQGHLGVPRMSQAAIDELGRPGPLSEGALNELMNKPPEPGPIAWRREREPDTHGRDILAEGGRRVGSVRPVQYAEHNGIQMSIEKLGGKYRLTVGKKMSMHSTISEAKRAAEEAVNKPPEPGPIAFETGARPVVHTLDIPGGAIMDRESYLYDKQTGEFYTATHATHAQLSEAAGVDLRANMPDGSRRYIELEIRDAVPSYDIPRHWIVAIGAMGKDEFTADLLPKLQEIENLPIDRGFRGGEQRGPDELIPARTEAAAQERRTVPPPAPPGGTAHDVEPFAGTYNYELPPRSAAEAAAVGPNRVNPLFPAPYRFAHVRQGVAPGQFMSPKTEAALGLNTPLKQLRHNAAYLLSNALMLTDPERVISRDYLSTMRHLMIGKMQDSLDQIAHDPELDLRHSGYKRPQDWYYRPSKGRASTAPLPEGVALEQGLTQDRALVSSAEGDKRLEDAANGIVSKRLKDFGIDEHDIHAYEKMKKDGIKVIHAAYGKDFRAEFKGTHWAIRAFYDRPLAVWRAITLNYRPAWLVNNFVGNGIMGLATYGPAGAEAYLRVLLTTERGEDKVIRLRNYTMRIPTLRRKFGRVFDDVAPEIHSAGLFGTQTKIPHLGYHEGKVAAIMANPAIRAMGFVPKKVGQGVIAVGRGITRAEILLAEDTGREAAFLREAGGDIQRIRDIAAKAGEANLSYEEALRRMDRPSVERAVTRINDVVGDFNDLSHVERAYVRRLIPFYSWYKVIVKVSAKYAARYPARLLLMKNISDANRTTGEPLLPAWLEGALLLGGPSRAGNQALVSTQGLNPYETLNQLPANPWSVFTPALNATVTAASGNDPTFGPGQGYYGPGDKSSGPLGYLQRFFGSAGEGLGPTRLYQQTTRPYQGKLYAPHTYGHVGPVSVNDFLLQYLGIPLRHVNLAEARRERGLRR